MLSLSELQEYHRIGLIEAVEKDDFTKILNYWRIVKISKAPTMQRIAVYREAMRRIDIPPEVQKLAAQKLEALLDETDW